ncbi:MAG: hypothetical protein GOMPHAMPRED_008177 [Gomphillus americanus]|uniref:Uncharacterized protein n=1 Tax=Gomphillus americanus TaxID=1940652 RepID=A0A8H3F2F7_9LECA|nr:MAG: hypothetical protein GOMPHAMPRED_008177 [Gomphillus americanus]
MASKIRKFKHTFNSTPLNSAPLQSPELQTSLLQVGMRVRKSIGQGYRTQWALIEEKLRAERTLYKKQNNDVLLWEDKSERAQNEDEINAIPASQDSITSIESSQSVSSCNPIPRPRRKRSRTEENEKECDDEAMDAISTHLRPIAQATSRRKYITPKNPFPKDPENNGIFTDFEDATFLDPRNHRSVEMDKARSA